MSHHGSTEVRSKLFPMSLTSDAIGAGVELKCTGEAIV